MSNAGSFSRSAVNHESGAKSGVSGIVSGIIMTCALLFLTPLFEYIPQVCFQVFIGHRPCLEMLFLVFNGSSTSIWDILQMTSAGIQSMTSRMKWIWH